MSNPDPDKVFFIKAYFDALRVRIGNLRTLHDTNVDGKSFRDEALILCLVYIDGLASSYYGDDATKENFCKAVTELSSNALFGKLHVKKLLDPDNDKYWAGAKTSVEELAKNRPGELLDQIEVADAIRKSGVPKQTQDSLIKRLWFNAIGAICYELMRNAAVHGLGASTLSFDETLHNGKLGFALNFDVLHKALQQISEHVAQRSIAKGEWFGRKDYFKTR